MNEFLKKVEEFHTAFNCPVLETPQLIPHERSNLRHELLREEVGELHTAIQEKDIVGISDALSDIAYVLAGAVLEFGLKDKFTELFNEVHRSNMSKACKSHDEAVRTQAWYWEKSSTGTYIKPLNGLFFVYRTEDNKVLKSVDYSPADLESIINK